MDGGFLARTQLDRLLALLRLEGYDTWGPRVEQEAIVMAPLDAAAQLPWGVTEIQEAGQYRLQTGMASRAFAWAHGPQTLKPLVFTPRESLWQADRDAQGRLRFRTILPEVQNRAVIGVRACDLAALRLMDQHFLAPGAEDPNYSQRREALFLVAINCTHPSATCFCASTGDGPEVQQGYDLLLDELDDGYILRAGSKAGERISQQLALSLANKTQWLAAQNAVATAATLQQRSLPAGNLTAPLFANLDHPRWQEVAERCLSCGNCTSVCPTCFCHRQESEATLDGQQAQQQREWDSCFSAEHSFVHGRSLRADTRQRYRQWLTHKLGGWHQQYGRSGCVGCGRCITWCPVAIDITTEVAAICAGREDA